MIAVDGRDAPDRPANRLLVNVPDEEFQEIQPLLSHVHLHARQVLHKQGERIDAVYFPNSGIVSMASVLSDGAMVEAATIGDEGVVGIEAFLSDDPVSPCETIVQVPVPHDSAEMMPTGDFRRALGRYRGFRRLVERYAEALCTQVVRITACNARHDVNERCARWLLSAHDHMHGHDFHLSQEFLAVMLGVRRQSVSAVATAFQTAGFIRYQHGHVTILNREGLEATACECYAAIRSAYERL